MFPECYGFNRTLCLTFFFARLAFFRFVLSGGFPVLSTGSGLALPAGCGSSQFISFKGFTPALMVTDSSCSQSKVESAYENELSGVEQQGLH